MTAMTALLEKLSTLGGKRHRVEYRMASLSHAALAPYVHGVTAFRAMHSANATSAARIRAA